MGAWIEISFPPKTVSHRQKSHPTWVRGLKSNDTVDKVSLTVGRTHTGAWVEIDLGGVYKTTKDVAPTRVRGLKSRTSKTRLTTSSSHSSRVRGLKYYTGGLQVHTGTSHSSRVRGLKSKMDDKLVLNKSHSSRVRGLKWADVMSQAQTILSHSSRVRGLKFLLK